MKLLLRQVRPLVYNKLIETSLNTEESNTKKKSILDSTFPSIFIFNYSTRSLRIVSPIFKTEQRQLALYKKKKTKKERNEYSRYQL